MASLPHLVLTSKFSINKRGSFYRQEDRIEIQLWISKPSMGVNWNATDKKIVYKIKYSGFASFNYLGFEIWGGYSEILFYSNWKCQILGNNLAHSEKYVLYCQALKCIIFRKDTWRKILFSLVISLMYFSILILQMLIKCSTIPLEKRLVIKVTQARQTTHLPLDLTSTLWFTTFLSPALKRAVPEFNSFISNKSQLQSYMSLVCLGALCNIGGGGRTLNSICRTRGARFSSYKKSFLKNHWAYKS